MTEVKFLNEVQALAENLQRNNDSILLAAKKAAETIKAGNWVQLFGSGHSVIPTMDCFPRYGGFVGFKPIMDPRLMWTTISGPGGAEEVLWLERQEGYMNVFLQHHTWNKDDIFIVISHGGQNAAPVEIALSAKEAGLYVIAITSEDNHLNKPVTHSSGKKIGDIADLVIYNGVTPEDAVVDVPGVSGKVGGLSTLSAIAIIQSLVSETALELARLGYKVKPFASPNVEGISKNHNEEVYVEFRKRLKETVSI
ncbi:sugar isomerase domain-containing protein [Neobacillus drentensis]|uniref:sugar isomerase domain-containing protein n=1 Tax=Neobacillus drentensis TaxID=220684 RepID=UPI002866E848|nr:sugar isomerase domain-containing protein [Neobacillus drentensis]MDR7238857.1 putative phosphosugar-binding protein [Neobacillus drentensis]